MDSILSIKVDGYEFTEKYKTKDITCKDCLHEVTTVKSYTNCVLCNSMNLSIRRYWDGTYSYISKSLKFKTGFLPIVYPFLISAGYDISFNDFRKNRFDKPDKVVTELMPWSLREFMVSDLDAFFSNSCGVYFPRGIYKAATNAGKNSFIASVCLTLDVTTLIIVHRKELFNQAYDFFTECGIKVSRFGQGKYELGKFTLAMVRTLKNRMDKVSIKKHLSQVSCLIVDECHRASASEYKVIVSQTDAFGRFYVSGTPLANTSDQALMDIVSQSGKVIAEVDNQFLIEKGYSQKPKVNIIEYGAYYHGEDYNSELKSMYYSQKRREVIRSICQDNLKKQVLIVVQHIEHGEYLFDGLYDLETVIEFVHGSDPLRSGKLERFESGQTNILISSMIMKEGVNIPTINVGINAFGGKSEITLKQVVGRLLRNDGTNTECFWYDFKDEGHYLSEHTSKRIELYRKEKFEINFILK